MDILGQMSTKLIPAQKDPLTGAITMQKDNVTVHIDFTTNGSDPKILVGTHKLLDLLIILLSQQNQYRGKSGDYHTKVELELSDYMMLCHIPDTKSSRDEVRTKVKSELAVLVHTSIEWVSMDRGAKNIPQHGNIKLFTKCEIKKGVISANFTSEMTSYLINAFVTKFPLGLLKLDGRTSNAYYIGKKLAYHYGFHSNINRGTNSCISVLTLLSSTPDICYEHLNQKDPSHWHKRIQLPLEKALDMLKENEIITSWEYCLAKKAPIPDIQRETASFFRFSKLYIDFEMKDFPLPKKVLT